MIKIVYVLISTEKDYYYEQALLSLYSLRIYNPEIEVVMLTDTTTNDSLKGNRDGIKQYVDRFILVDFEQEYLPEQRSRILKTRLPEYVEGDFLYIDNDTIINGKLDKLDEIDCEVAAVYNRHIKNWSDIGTHSSLSKYHSLTGTIPEIDSKITDHYNGGVFLVKDTPNAKNFFKTWHEMWRHSSLTLGYHKDQPDMWRANYLHGNIIKELSGIYNMQAIYPKGSLKFMADCRIFHYFTSAEEHLTNFILRDPEFLEILRKNGITEEIHGLLTSIFDEYFENIEFIVDDKVRMLRSPFIRICDKMLRLCPFLDRIAYQFYKLKYGKNNQK